MTKRLISFFILFMTLSCVTLAHAQQDVLTIDRLTIDMQPSIPEANATVSLSVRSVVMDLDRAVIAWYVNGKRIASGEGERTTTATLGSLGSATTIRVEAVGADGVALSAERVVRPAEVDLLWEADSYAPPFYAGRHVPSPNSSVRLEAIPRLRRTDGSVIATSDIIFTWRKNDGIVKAISGRGKSSVTLPAPQLFGADTISVEATSVDGTVIASARVNIPSVEPTITLYQSHPLFGIEYHRALETSITIPDNEATFVAVPYFAATTNPNDLLFSYAWRVNGISITPDPVAPSILTINADNSDGKARIELSLSHAADYLLDARGIWNLVFNSGRSGSDIELFGAPTNP